MLIILIILTILAVVLTKITCDDTDYIYIVSGIGAIILVILDVIAIVSIIFYFEDGIVASEKIKMYEKENNKIEEKVDVLVKEYMNYEGKTLTEFKSDSSMTLISLYPDLKSDELVKTQIKTYTENNKKIKKLKEDEINLKIGKWLLYFGG